jgi:primary-amine oxidase
MSAARHPLDQLTADEIEEVRSVLSRAGVLADTSRFACVGLEEPPKSNLFHDGHE